MLPEQCVYGIDVDGVLANFTDAFSELLISTTRDNRFPSGYWYDRDFPPVWDWPEHYGYSAQQIDAAWERVKTTEFWRRLEPLSGRTDLVGIPVGARVYFITSRVGSTALRQTQRWLEYYLPAEFTVRHEWSAVISNQKGAAAIALDLDFYIDDNVKNVNWACRLAPACRTYLLDKPYNQPARNAIDVRAHRVLSVAEALRHFNAATPGLLEKGMQS